MSEIQAKPGQFCWAELMTTDAKAGSAFYMPLLGWTMRSDEMPGGRGMYHTFDYEGLAAAACFEMTPDMQGLPPNWLPYIRVEDLEGTVAAAREAGATIALDCHEAGDFGRFAVVTDPQGATFALWKARTHFGARNGHVVGRHCWTELIASDTGKAKDFYTKVFGWDTHTADMGGFEYTSWLLGREPFGGMMAKPPGMGDAPSHWMVYFSVPSISGAIDYVRNNGGTVCAGPIDVPDVGVMGAFMDPQGAAFSLIELTSQPA